MTTSTSTQPPVDVQAGAPIARTTRHVAVPTASASRRSVWRRRVGVGARRTAAIGLLLAAWEAASRAGVVDPFTASSPSAVGEVLAGLFADGTIWPHIEATFTASLLGLALGIVAGVVLGTVAGLFRPVAELLEPVMVLLSAVPRVIFAPLLIIWLGIGVSSKVALAFLLVAVLVFFAVYGGIQDTDARLIDRIRTFGGGTRVLLREVYVPAITGRVLGNLKIAVGFAFTGAVVGEFVASARGLGYLLMFAQSQYNAALVFALITLIVVFVLLLFALTGVVERRALRWRTR
ncbi:MAG: ABC transporter permease [Actinobacteria bacterium]|jgi:NitT/TauT family transport system permease protein|nr:ABC transporter permease [Actinomycetota bacterium]